MGISHDSVGKQKSFSNRFKFDYPLLSDSANQVATLFGVHRSSVLGTKRETFVIDTDRRVVGVVRSALRASLHADRALGFLRSRAGT